MIDYFISFILDNSGAGLKQVFASSCQMCVVFVFCGQGRGNKKLHWIRFVLRAQ